MLAVIYGQTRLYLQELTREQHCLNCKLAGHRTEVLHFPHPKVVKYRRERKEFADRGPQWAMHLNFPPRVQIPKSLGPEAGESNDDPNTSKCSHSSVKGKRKGKRRGKGSISAVSEAAERAERDPSPLRYRPDPGEDFVNPEAVGERHAQTIVDQIDGTTTATAIMVASQESTQGSQDSLHLPVGAEAADPAPALQPASRSAPPTVAAWLTRMLSTQDPDTTPKELNAKSTKLSAKLDKPAAKPKRKRERQSAASAEVLSSESGRSRSRARVEGSFTSMVASTELSDKSDAVLTATASQNLSVSASAIRSCEVLAGTTLSTEHDSQDGIAQGFVEPDGNAPMDSST